MATEKLIDLSNKTHKPALLIHIQYTSSS